MLFRSLYVNGSQADATVTSLVPQNGVQDAALVLGARALSKNAVTPGETTTWADYDSFYKGALAEVRVWNGARTASDLHEDSQSRFSVADVTERRAEVYAKWEAGASTLPVELICHYNFQTLPGAVEAKDVM